ncbi:Membrane protein YdfJ [Streptomyces sp. YIM 121038]|uniref:MMPL family transporter n=1 Tax=Streptomyces sp. YIM 121038 TaxID=2136401 RepID=UPI00110FFF0C|nr:MMPL family transporter [Streptomyces sp. YIM 121038]QCX75236.1 Membrane protein YdfJ [Streptomyces sp. YIM 121038]
MPGTPKARPDQRRQARRGAAWLVCGRRAKWLVLVLWLAALVIAAPFAQKLTDEQDNTTSSWVPRSAESTQVLDVSEEFRPETMPMVVVFAREDDPLTAADRERIDQGVGRIKQLRSHWIRGDETRGPTFDKKGGGAKGGDAHAAQVYVPLTVNNDTYNDLPDAVDDVRDAVGDSADGLDVYVTGPAGIGADFSKAFADIDSTLLLAAGGVVVVALLITYRSPVLLLVPLFSALVSLFTAQALIYLLAEHAGLTVNGQSAGILTVLVFGAGTDYALLLVARYREELRRHEDRHEAMALALHRAGPAVIASSATVVVSMLVLLAAEMNSTRGLGPVAAIGVGVALLVMLSLFPALLVICGRWLFWPKIPRHGSADPAEHGVWARMGRRIARRPRLTWVATSVALAALSLGLLQLRAAGVSNEDAFLDKPNSVTGQEVSAEYFPAGSGDPLVVVADRARAEDVSRVVSGTRGVDPATVAVPPGTKAEHDGKVLYEAVLTDPSDSEAAKDTVERVRNAVHDVPDADAKIGGGTATLLDMDEATIHDDKLVIPLVLVVVLLILALLLRAIVAPLLLIATVVLSFSAALGISALVFRHVFDFPGESTDFPLFVFVFLVALGIDYNIFLTTRVREDAAAHGTRPGVVTALAATGAVITSAGLVLAGTFAVLGTIPMVAFVEVGFSVALGVLLDTFIVRSILVTSVFLDVGPKIWWPHALAKEQAPEQASPTGDASPSDV